LAGTAAIDGRVEIWLGKGQEFVGHCGPAFAATAARKSIPLWVVFVAVQLVDVWWAVFVLLGIEKVRVESGITATNPLDLYYMPYTHGFVGSALRSIAAGILYYLFRGVEGRLAAVIVGAAVWVLDLFGAMYLYLRTTEHAPVSGVVRARSEQFA
jgi:hypothetical protein